MIQNLFSPQYPTFPATDKFGQTIMYMGCSKIEMATIIIASGIVSNPTAYNGQLLPETIAEESYNIALAIFEKIDEEYKKAVANGGNGTGLIQCPPSSKL